MTEETVDAPPPSEVPEEEEEEEEAGTWDPEKDTVCCDVTAFFREFPKGPVTQKSEVWRPGNEKPVPIGKTMYALRTKSRQSEQTPLVKLRLEALKQIPGFASFLDQPVICKPKPTPDIINIAKGLKMRIPKMQANELELMMYYQENLAKIARTEWEIFSHKRQRLH
jgi:hypothetical protein